jgi:hypothetical protein
MSQQTANPAHADRTEWAEANEEALVSAPEDLTLEALTDEAGMRYGRSDESPSNLAWQIANSLSEADARQALANAIAESLRANTNDDHDDREEWTARED